MRVAHGRRIEINGRPYLAGDELPALSPQVAAQLIDRGDIVDEKPRKREAKAEE